jgi:two-component system alkaline phosphatase synthesis response regulator PhoP
VSKILIVEDSRDYQLMLKRLLKRENHDIHVAHNVAEAREKILTHEFDLIILDVTLPLGDGFELCADMQADERLRPIPIIFLSVHEDISRKVAAFALGAEDYIAKSFNPVEFRARVDAKLRKSAKRPDSEQTLVKGQLKVSLLDQRAYVKGKEVNLTPLEFKLLAYFARNEGVVLSREQILAAVWGQNVHVFDRTVDTHVSALRRKLAPCGKYIRSVLGSGYSFSVYQVEQKAA